MTIRRSCVLVALLSAFAGGCKRAPPGLCVRIMEARCTWADRCLFPKREGIAASLYGRDHAECLSLAAAFCDEAYFCREAGVAQPSVRIEVTPEQANACAASLDSATCTAATPAQSGCPALCKRTGASPASSQTP